MNSEEYRLMRRCEDTHWWYASLRFLLEKTLKRIFLSGTLADILDAGCGTGGNLAFLQDKFPQSRIIGFDFHEEAVELSRCRGLEVGLVQASVHAIPFLPKSFDAVICADVLYFRGIEESHALAEINRVLKPGGVLLLNLPAFESLRGGHDLAVSTRRRYLQCDVEKLLKEAGFSIEKIFYWNSFLFPLVWLKRNFLTRKGKTASDLIIDFPPIVNSLLQSCLRLEIALKEIFRPPFGTSVFAVARKSVLPRS